jgi:hypothetical protein
VKGFIFGTKKEILKISRDLIFQAKFKKIWSTLLIGKVNCKKVLIIVEHKYSYSVEKKVELHFYHYIFSLKVSA